MLSGPEVILLNLLDTQIRVPDYSLIDFQIVQVFEIQLQNVYVVDCNTPPYIQKVDCVLHFYFSLIQDKWPQPSANERNFQSPHYHNNNLCYPLNQRAYGCESAFGKPWNNIGCPCQNEQSRRWETRV